jgi:hypothetical protein
MTGVRRANAAIANIFRDMNDSDMRVVWLQQTYISPDYAPPGSSSHTDAMKRAP